MSDPDRLSEIRRRRAAMPDGPLDVDVDRNEEEYYMRWAMVRYGPPDDQGWRDWIAATNAANRDAAEFIAHAPEDIDWLIGQVDHAQAEVARLKRRIRELESAAHDPKHDWTAAHHHPWNNVDERYVVWEPDDLEHFHDGASGAMQLRDPKRVDEVER